MPFPRHVDDFRGEEIVTFPDLCSDVTGLRKEWASRSRSRARTIGPARKQRSISGAPNLLSLNNAGRLNCEVTTLCLNYISGQIYCTTTRMATYIRSSAHWSCVEISLPHRTSLKICAWNGLEHLQRTWHLQRNSTSRRPDWPLAVNISGEAKFIYLGKSIVKASES